MPRAGARGSSRSTPGRCARRGRRTRRARRTGRAKSDVKGDLHTIYLEGLRSMQTSEILCVGEILWDSLPTGLFLGGAPFNVACHLRASGVPVTIVSRVGADRLGEEVLERAARYGVGTDLVQVDPVLPTGFVKVALDAAGNAKYEILEPVAWDAIALNDALLRRAA